MPPPATGCALGIDSMWDLFCGVGGFGLHCAQPQTRLTGIEISAEAIACARQSAQRLGLLHVDFQALDSTRFATAEGRCRNWCWSTRRGAASAGAVRLFEPDGAGLYSLFQLQRREHGERYRDVAGYHIERVQLFDMFPHTAHYEVLTLLVRR